MLTTRDMQIIEFLNDYKIASTSTIAELFFPSIEACYKRLQVLVRNKAVKRIRDSINNEYLYYHKKIPRQLKHALLVTDFYRELHKKSEVFSFKIEPTLDNIRPDAIFAYRYMSKNYLGLLEVEISNKGFDYGKYERFYSSECYKNHFPVMPTVFVVGNKNRIKIPDRIKVDFKIIDVNMEGLL